MARKDPQQDTNNSNKRKLDKELDRLEQELEDLRILHEQFFVDVLPHPPDEQKRNVKRHIRQLLKAPFKTSAIRFRLRSLVHRYQTYHTYWERVFKQREEGTYVRDVFKAELRERLLEETKQEGTNASRAERAMRQLFDSYVTALEKTGNKPGKLDFDSFKKSLVKKAQQLKKEQGVKKLLYKIVVKDGKVVIKASGK